MRSFGKSEVGGVMFSLGLLVSGSFVTFTITRLVANRGSRVVRLLSFFGLLIGAVASMTWGLSSVIESEDVQCVLWPRPNRAAVKRVLGRSPAETLVFVPSYPFQSSPPEDSERELEIDYVGPHVFTRTPTWRYNQDGVRVYFDRVTLERGTDWWDSPRVLLDEDAQKTLEQLWGQPTEANAYLKTWRSKGFRAQLITGENECGSSEFIKLERTRPNRDLLGPGPTSPLADFDGALLGRTPTELGVDTRAGAQIIYRQSNSHTVMLDGPNGGERLRLKIDPTMRIQDWSIELGCGSTTECEELLVEFERRFGPAREEPARPERSRDVRHFSSIARPELAWTINNGASIRFGAGAQTIER